MLIKKLSITQRVIALFIYTLVSYFVYVYFAETWLLKSNNSSIWLTTIFAYFSYHFLVIHFFVSPKDSLVTSATTFFMLLTINTMCDITIGRIFWWIGISVSFFILIASILNLMSDKKVNFKRVNSFTYEICQKFGKGEVLFFPLLLFCTLSFYGGNEVNINISVVIALNSFWGFAVIAEPAEFIVSLFNNEKQGLVTPIGIINRIDSPNIVRVEIDEDCVWEGNNYTAQLNKDKWVRIIPLDKQFRNDSLIGTGIYFPMNKSEDNKSCRNTNCKEVFILSDKKPIDKLVFGRTMESLVYIGFVVERSNISTIYIELTTSDYIEEGYLLILRQGEYTIHYQVIDGTTDEEVFNSNPKGKTIIKASQIGIYTDDKRFEKYSWVPNMNTPVFLVKKDLSKEMILGKKQIGVIPNSNYKVNIKLDDLIQYHCAILGVTGTGKTELAFDLIRKNIASGIKVVCVDITGDYLRRLSDLSPVVLDLEKEKVKRINELIMDAETGEYNAAKERKAFFDYIKTIRKDIGTQVIDFMKDDSNLAILQLPSISNTRATLRITEIYLSLLFAWAKKNADEDIIQIVLEEAHTIIPERNYFGYDNVDTDSVIGRISQIALQGRKYNIGLMLISQRTALVSKTVLSQCNTFFTFNLIDKTSLEFLRNVYGNDQISVIQNLKRLQLLAYGKAINSENPVVIEIPYDPRKESKSKRKENEV